MEHQAVFQSDDHFFKNFRGWKQFRQIIEEQKIMIYIVRIEEQLAKTYEIEADSPEEAYAIVQEGYNKGYEEFVLSADDFVAVSIDLLDPDE